MRRTLIAAAVLNTIALSTHPASAAVCDGAFHAVPHEAVSQTDFRGVEIISRNDAWAVGVRFDRNGPSTTLAEHWDGTQWTVVPTPNPKRTSEVNVLSSVSGTATDDVWAVGTGVTSIFVDHPLIEHWNGSSWRVVPGSNVTGVLHAVTAITEDDAWAGGSFLPPNDPPRALLLHWNGRSWSRVPAPVAGIETVLAMAATGRNDVWAVGRMEAEGGNTRPFAKHWDGEGWSNVPVPGFAAAGGSLHAITAIARNDVWAVGTRGIRAVALHWDGRSWDIVPIEQPSALSGLSGVAATGTADVWAVGGYFNDNERLRPFAEHWNGASWTRVDAESVSAGDNSLAAVDAIEGRRWAVGSSLRAGVEGGVIQLSCGT